MWRKYKDGGNLENTAGVAINNKPTGNSEFAVIWLCKANERNIRMGFKKNKERKTTLVMSLMDFG